MNSAFDAESTVCQGYPVVQRLHREKEASERDAEKGEGESLFLENIRKRFGPSVLLRSELTLRGARGSFLGPVSQHACWHPYPALNLRWIPLTTGCKSTNT